MIRAFFASSVAPSGGEGRVDNVEVAAMTLAGLNPTGTGKLTMTTVKLGLLIPLPYCYRTYQWMGGKCIGWTSLVDSGLKQSIRRAPVSSHSRADCESRCLSVALQATFSDRCPTCPVWCMQTQQGALFVHYNILASPLTQAIVQTTRAVSSGSE
eukprot:903485-Amphidinium_carterae.1